MLDAEIGQSIGQGVRIGQINVLTDFKINALIDEHYIDRVRPVSYTHLRAHETVLDLVCRLLLEKKKNTRDAYIVSIITTIT